MRSPWEFRPLTSPVPSSAGQVFGGSPAGFEPFGTPGTAPGGQAFASPYNADPFSRGGTSPGGALAYGSPYNVDPFSRPSGSLALSAFPSDDPFRGPGGQLLRPAGQAGDPNTQGPQSPIPGQQWMGPDGTMWTYTNGAWSQGGSAAQGASESNDAYQRRMLAQTQGAFQLGNTAIQGLGASIVAAIQGGNQVRQTELLSQAQVELARIRQMGGGVDQAQNMAALQAMVMALAANGGQAGVYAAQQNFMGLGISTTTAVVIGGVALLGLAAAYMMTHPPQPARHNPFDYVRRPVERGSRKYRLEKRWSKKKSKRSKKSRSRRAGRR